MTWFLAFGGFVALILLHEAGHYLAAKGVGMRVERFSLFFPPTILRFKPKGRETEYCIGALPFGGYVKISGMNPNEDLPPEILPRTYYRQPVWKRIVVIAAGPAMNALVAFVLLYAFFLFGAKEVVPVVEKVAATAPAAGKILPGDRIVSVDGEAGGPQAFRKAIASHRCAGVQEEGCRAAEPVRVDLTRAGKELSLTIYPRYDSKTKPSAPRLGFQYAQGPAGYGPDEAARYSVDTAWQITSGTLTAIAQLFKTKQREQLSGVVGTFAVTEQAFSFDAWQAVIVLAIVSLSLALINLFPFLPLDGGHIFFSLLEKVRGKAVSFAAMERASVVGFAIVILLFAIGLSNDIGRLTGEGFGPP